MSQVATGWRLAAVVSLTAAAAWAQSARQSSLDWRRLGQPSVDLRLAGPASGPVNAVWYSPDGGTLFARVSSGKVFATADFENWSVSDAKAPEASSRAAAPARLPEASARAVTASGDSRRLWSLGKDLFVSEDSGQTWTNISGYGDASVIGTEQRDIAINPSDPEAFAVANANGVWQTHDGGQSWVGLNTLLPNLPVSRITSTKRGSVQVLLEDGRAVQLVDARAPWALAATSSLPAPEQRDRDLFSKSLGAEITAVTRSGDFVYAGSSEGRMWVSRDRGGSWTNVSQTASRGSIERIFVDADAPRAAIAVSPGPGARVLRTTNGGAVWDDVTANLPDTAVHAAAADPATAMAYVATDRGLFSAHLDLNAFTPVTGWTVLGGALPAAPVRDVALDAGGGQLFAAVEGYGLYTAAVRSGPLRILNSADLTKRPAAPGSVISIVGGKITSVREGDLSYPVLGADDDTAQVQVPFESRPALVALTVEGGGGASSLPLSIRSVSPAIFVDRDGAPFLVDGDTGLTLDSTSPVHPGTRLELMATGLGRVQPDWPTGAPAPAQNPPAVVANVEAFVDGIPAQVSRATLAPGYVGYYVIEIRLPDILNAGPGEMYLRADGQESNRVRVLLDAR